MADTFSQVYMHCVFAVKHRQSLLHKDWRAYMAGILREKRQKAILINGVEDHVHLLIGLIPDIHLSSLIRDIKTGSSKYINDQKWLNRKFEWQNGYGIFSVSRFEIDRVYKYIAQQEAHHSVTSFRDEYSKLIEEIDPNPLKKYMFHDPSDE